MLTLLLKTHYRLGFTRTLLAVDLLLLTVIAADFVSYNLRQLSVRPVVTVETSLPYDLGIPILSFIAFLMVVLPLAIAMLKIAGVPGFATVNPSRRPYFVLVAHSILCVGFAYATILAGRMEVLSGWRQIDSGFALEFQSAFGAIVRSAFFTDVIKAFGSFWAVAVSAAGAYVLIGKEISKPMKQYMVRAELADLPSELRPIYGRPSLPLADAGAAPPTPATSQVAQEIIRGYYSKSLTMSQRNAYIDRVLTECLLMTCDLVFDRTDQRTLKDVPNVAFFTGPGRAFEAAISCVGGAQTFVLSPYSSLSLKRLIDSYSANSCCQVVHLEMKPSETYASWSAQEEAIVREAKGATIHGKAILILSEVSYATGLRVPLDRLISRIKRDFSGNGLSVIVDGTNTVGNRCRVPLAADWDAYVMAPYKWLMTTEPCALVATKNATKVNSEAYGRVREGGRKRDEDVRAIASFRGALDVIQHRGLEYFWGRCDQLRRSFRLDLPKSFQIVGSQSGMDSTYILSCFPTEPSSWRLSQAEMSDQLPRICSYASMIAFDPTRTWLRLAIPYHLDPRQLNRLNEFLDDNST